MARGKPSSSLWESPKGSAIVRRRLPWHLPPRGPWRRAWPALDCGALSGLGRNGWRRTRRPRPLSAASPRWLCPDAGDCRRTRSPIWVTPSPSAGGAFAAVVRPVRATPARTPMTLGVPRDPWTPHGTLPTWTAHGTGETDKPCRPSWPTPPGRAKEDAARCRPRARPGRPWPRAAR
jgi:hypothetical protein